MEFGTLVTNPVSRDPTVTASAFATPAEITATG
jgi:alkanesulfonate monooxygenase SsuD/methylene tetrahydromethanopterin reductase-like flavin-dependent oxidoreductase (luciferase family)